MIKEKLGKHLDRWVHAAFPFLFKRSVNPNLLTLLGPAGSIGAAGTFAQGHLRAGALLMLAGGFFDLVDGVVARHFGTATSFGCRDEDDDLGLSVSTTGGAITLRSRRLRLT